MADKGESNPFKIYQLTNKLTGYGASVPQKSLKIKMADTLLELNKEITVYTQVNGAVRGQHSRLSEEIRDLRTENASIRDQIAKANQDRVSAQEVASQTIAEKRRHAEEVDGENLSLKRQLERCQAELRAAQDVADSARAARAVAEAQLAALQASESKSGGGATTITSEHADTPVAGGPAHKTAATVSGPASTTTPTSDKRPLSGEAVDQRPVNAKKRKLNQDEDLSSAELPRFKAGQTFFQQTLDAVTQGSAPPADAEQTNSLSGIPSILHVTDVEMEEFKLYDDDDEL